MKRIKSTMLCMMALMTFSLMFVNVLTVQAAKEKTPGGVYVEPYTDSKGNVKEQKKFRVVTYSTGESFNVEYGPNNKIKSLKVNKKGMTAKVTEKYSNNSDDYNYNSATISLYATKAGTYTVSFKVVNSKGKTRKKCKVKVQAVNSSSLIKKVTFGKKTVISRSSSTKGGAKKTVTKESTKVSGKSGKLKITPNSQYKITGMVVLSVGKNGKYSYKKVKNGKKITLSKKYYKGESASSDLYSRPTKKYTYIYVSYKDKFLGSSVTYSVAKKDGKKVVKRVYTGRGYKSTDYFSGLSYSPDVTLWK